MNDQALDGATKNGMGGSPGGAGQGSTGFSPGNAGGGGWPAVTLQQVQGSIATTDYINRGTLTLAICVMQNGFTVVGQSAAASPENYNEDIGQRLALKDAERQIWPLLGYQLRELLWLSQQQGAGAGTNWFSSIDGGLAGAGTMTETEASRIAGDGGGDGSNAAQGHQSAVIHEREPLRA